MKMPGKSYRGDFKGEEVPLAQVLEAHVARLATDIGPRHVYLYEDLQAAADYIEAELQFAGYKVTRQGFQVEGRLCDNLIVEIKGVQDEGDIIVVGAHYDSVPECPAANDNGTGVAALLALADAFANRKLDKTLRFVAFVNEEPPWFQTENMGSLVYAKSCRQNGDNIVGMISLETMGYYSDEKNSQQYPWPFSLFYPSTGNFIGFVGNTKSSKFVKRVVGLFREKCEFPSEGAALPGSITGIGWSDHWSFWQAGYPGLMVTDTAPFRYPYYHTAEDTPEKLQYDRFAQVVRGMEAVLAELLKAK